MQIMQKNNSIRNANILITGGAGFVGSHLVEQLLPLKPNKIFIIDNLFRGRINNMKQFIKRKEISFIKGDICDYKLINKLISQSDYCFHMAALRINACAANPKQAFKIMIEATFNLFNAAQKYRLKKIIFSSSASVYGLAQHFPTPETDNPYDNQTFYGAAKLFGEQILNSYWHMFDLRYIVLRYFNIYGPRMDTDGKYTEVLIRWLKSIKKNTSPKICGDGLTSMDFVYVTDVAKANVAALCSSLNHGIFNIGSGEETNLRTLLKLLLKVNHSKLKSQHEEESVINPVRRRWADISKAKKLLKYYPQINLEDGLKMLSSWYFNKNEKI